MTQQLSDADTANVEIIESLSGMGETEVMDKAAELADVYGDTVSDELAEGAAELSLMAAFESGEDEDDDDEDSDEDDDEDGPAV
jgi:hypothetical protein